MINRQQCSLRFSKTKIIIRNDGSQVFSVFEQNKKMCSICTSFSINNSFLEKLCISRGFRLFQREIWNTPVLNNNKTVEFSAMDTSRRRKSNGSTWCVYVHGIILNHVWEQWWLPDSEKRHAAKKKNPKEPTPLIKNNRVTTIKKFILWYSERHNTVPGPVHAVFIITYYT